MIDAANDSGFIKQTVPKPFKLKTKTKPFKAPWFNNECVTLRRQYKRAKNLRHRVNSVENYKYLLNASKTYKKCIDKQYNKYRKDLITKLRSLKSSDPKYYWSLLNKADKVEILQKVSLETFANHFKKLNTIETNQDDFKIDESEISDHNLSSTRQLQRKRF